LGEGLRRLQGNRALYRRLLLNFADQHRHESKTLRRALDAGDFGHVRHRVHAIKGVAGNLAAKPLQAAAAVLDGLIKSANHSEGATDAGALTTALEAFNAALSFTLNAVASLMPADGDRTEPAAGGAGPTHTPEMAAGIAAGLRAAAELGDVSELTALARGISARPGNLSATGDRIRRMAEDFDFEGILKLVAELEAQR
jgi:HPt (histidine-containing phosphotransfer) domain-containing protein